LRSQSTKTLSDPSYSREVSDLSNFRVFFRFCHSSSIVLFSSAYAHHVRLAYLFVTSNTRKMYVLHATCKNLGTQRNKEATMRRYLIIRNKEVHLGLLITLIVVSMVATVYALTSYVFHQTLEVLGTAIKIYPNQPTTSLT
jgi:hypothetical protein